MRYVWRLERGPFSCDGINSLFDPRQPCSRQQDRGLFHHHDGHKLRYAIFRSSHAVAKGTVILLHGRNEFIEKYFETIRELTDRGLWVATSTCAARVAPVG